MKVFTAHIKPKNIAVFIICILILFTSILACTNKSQTVDNSDNNIELPTVTEQTASEVETTVRKIMRDKNGNEYTPTSNLTVYLTFDDGPSSNTPEILDILNFYGIGATFFVINGKYNSYMKDIVDRGSAIALHSYSHKYPEIYSSKGAFMADLDKIHNLVLSETGVDTRIIRFPGGSSNTISRRYCNHIMVDITKETVNKGYIYFDWNAENGDADGKEISAANQIKKATKYPKNANNVVILMHDIDSCGVNLNALKGIIDFYQSRGASFNIITENSPPIHHKVNN